MDISISKKQKAFIDAKADEVLFGGAAGGGKSYGQLIDAFLYALKYAGSKQLVLRRTYPELEKSLIRVSLELYPAAVYKYNSANHMGRFINGSLIDFAYCDSEKDVYKYQSAEYDVIRFDELTHFSEQMYIYLISRLRGANDFPKQIKSSTNPGGVGHQWVKSRFIDIGEPNREHHTPIGSRIFIPSRVQDNSFLLEKDPEYLIRLENLDEDTKKALLYGNWDIFEGQYFREFNRDIHTIPPFSIPPHWQRFRCLDYGQDTCCCLWCAVDESRRIYVYRELHEPGLILSVAAQRILDRTPSTEQIRYTVASPDLWNKQQSSGESGAEVMFKAGLKGLMKADNARIQGWRLMREYLQVVPDEFGQDSARIKIFSTCPNLIKSIPALIYDDKNIEDCDTEPHQFTHAPDALRYGLMSRPPLTRVIVPLEEPLPDSRKVRQPVLGTKVNIKGVFK